MKNWKYIEGAKTGNSSHTKEEAKTKDEYFKILKFYQTQGYKTKAGESNPNGSIKLHKGDDSVEIVLVGNTKAGNYSKDELLKYAKMYGDKELIDHINSGKMTQADLGARIRWFQYQWDGKDINGKIVDKSKTGNEDKTGAEEFFKQLSDDVKEREKKDDADIEKVGNFKTGKSALKPGDRVQSYGVQGTVRKVEGENSDNIYGEPIIEVEWDNGTVKKVGEHYLRKIGNKVGNATPNYRYKDFLITNPEGHEYIVFLKDGRTVGYRGTTSKAQAEDWCDWHDPKTGKSIGNKVGNKKLKFTDKQDGLKEFVYDEENDKGYIYYDGKLVDTIPHAGQGWLNLIKQKAFSSGVMNKIGNSAQDDKFAYVMREFDEGKLKTPDGKVVTDPAQAKAIAYSESKKTENGLARARNAMACNKKVKNSAVREYKHPDGRVAQIDFNEDGSDADMSIYEGTKEIEQKNFSTIRDAEQYVTSHGFRRI